MSLGATCGRTAVYDPGGLTRYRFDVQADTFSAMPSTTEDVERTRTVFGYCDALLAGSHTISVTIRQLVPRSWCQTGWSVGSSYSMEVRELSSASPLGTTGITTVALQDSKANGYVTARNFNFLKQLAYTRLRLAYVDSISVINQLSAGKTCRWDILVDGKACSDDIRADVFTDVMHKPQYQPRSVAGYCGRIKAGRHGLNVKVSEATVGSLSGSCHTGWSDGSSFTLEAHEVVDASNHMCIHGEKRCEFPFTIGGQDYYQCLPYSGQLWCSTAKIPTSSTWGYCRPCPQDESISNTIGRSSLIDGVDDAILLGFSILLFVIFTFVCVSIRFRMKQDQERKDAETQELLPLPKELQGEEEGDVYEVSVVEGAITLLMNG